MSVGTALAFTSRRPQILVLAAALVLTALAWSYMGWLAARMGATAPQGSAVTAGGQEMATTGMQRMGTASGRGMGQTGPQDVSAQKVHAAGARLIAPGFARWTVVHYFFIFTMWAVMMVAMMTPSVTPMVLIYARVAHRSLPQGHLPSPAAWFVVGYLASWGLFSALAALAQWGLEALALLTPMMVATSRGFGAAVLIAAGLYQWLPIKNACLASCRAPLVFMQRHGGLRLDAAGSLRLGFLHGGYCVGCCWALMAVLFVTGVMNLLWIAVLMIVVLLEKVIPHGRGFARLTGGIAVGAGIWLIVA
ncbi:MAG: DUF2182 domain-containing protein [Steroidobacteraceae bacterium]